MYGHTCAIDQHSPSHSHLPPSRSHSPSPPSPSLPLTLSLSPFPTHTLPPPSLPLTLSLSPFPTHNLQRRGITTFSMEECSGIIHSKQVHTQQRPWVCHCNTERDCSLGQYELTAGRATLHIQTFDHNYSLISSPYSWVGKSMHSGREKSIDMLLTSFPDCNPLPEKTAFFFPVAVTNGWHTGLSVPHIQLLD